MNFKTLIGLLVCAAILPSSLRAGPEEDALEAELSAVRTARLEKLRTNEEAAAANRAKIEGDADAATVGAWQRYRDSFIPPTASYAFDPASITEGQSTTLRVTLSKPWKQDFRVPLQFAGPASDYSPSAVEIVIPNGETVGSVTVLAVDDAEVEDDEVVAIGDATLTIVSDDVPPPPPPPPPVDPVPDRPEAFPPVLAFDEIRIRQHPRLFWRDDAAIRLTAAPDLKKLVDASASGSLSANRMLCRAIRYRLGDAASGPLAVADLMAITLPVLDTHYGQTHLQPVSLGYDWLYDALTDEQRTALRARIYAALSSGSYWTGYNYPAGVGMISALAIEGDATESEGIPAGLVRKYWDENWWLPARLHNREYERNWQPGGGMREGWGYLADQSDGILCKAAWESATGDTQSLDYPWMTRWPLLLLHQCRNPTMFSMPCWTYGNESLYQAGVANILQAGTGARDAKVASLSAWLYQQNAKVFSARVASEQFIYRILIGDPTVKPQSPADLGLPLQYATRGTGYVYDRTSWDDAISTRVFFGAQWNLTRDFPIGDVMIASKGRILLGCRSMLYRHHYAPNWVRNIPLLYQGTTLIAPADGDSDPRRAVVCTLTRDGNRWVADLRNLYPRLQIQWFTRSFEFDRSGQIVRVVDDFKGPAGVTPRIAWNTPLAPVVDDGITFTNGDSSCRMTFGSRPAEILLRGGETLKLDSGAIVCQWAQDYSGVIASNVASDLGKDFLSRELVSQISRGGFWTVFVTPELVDGAYQAVTTIEVGK